jgi:hypothetical protein
MNCLLCDGAIMLDSVSAIVHVICTTVVGFDALGEKLSASASMRGV